MPPVLQQDVVKEDEAANLAARALGVRPRCVVRQSLSDSGKSVYRVYLPDGQSVVLRTSTRPRAFAYTQHNLAVLGALGLSVQSVRAAGRTASGGSFIILNWIPGEDLLYELGGMSCAQMTAVAARVVELQQRVCGLPPAKGFGWAPIGRDGPLQAWTDVFGKPAPASLLDDGTKLGKLRARLSLVRSRVEAYFSTVAPAPFLDDLTTKNVLVENGILRGIIDVDFVCYGDPLLSVGATIAFIAADVGQAGRFYGEELIRCWNPSPDALLATRFYAALWTIGFLSAAETAGESARASALAPIADAMLGAAEA